MGVPCFLLWLFNSFLNTGGPESPWFLAPFLTPIFAAFPSRVKFDTPTPSEQVFSFPYTFKFFLTHQDQRNTSYECPINYPISKIDILANTMCREFLACSFVTKLNTGIKGSIMIHVSNIWHLCIFTYYKTNLSLKLFYLMLLPQGCSKKMFQVSKNTNIKYNTNKI